MICVIFGKRGAGKTTYIKQQIIIPATFQTFIIDTLNEYQNVAVLANEHNYESYFKSRLLVDSFEQFDYIINSFCYKHKFPINLVISEIDYWSSSYYISQSLLKLLRYSRHYQVSLICDVRNPIEINRKITALADKFIIFKITEPRYLDYFKEYSKNLPDKIKKLKNYEYIDYTP